MLFVVQVNVVSVWRHLVQSALVSPLFKDMCIGAICNGNGTCLARVGTVSSTQRQPTSTLLAHARQCCQRVGQFGVQPSAAAGEGTFFISYLTVCADCTNSFWTTANASAVNSCWHSVAGYVLVRHAVFPSHVLSSISVFSGLFQHAEKLPPCLA